MPLQYSCAGEGSAPRAPRGLSSLGVLPHYRKSLALAAACATQPPTRPTTASSSSGRHALGTPAAGDSRPDTVEPEKKVGSSRNEPVEIIVTSSLVVKLRKKIAETCESGVADRRADVEVHAQGPSGPADDQSDYFAQLARARPMRDFVRLTEKLQCGSPGD